MENTEYIQDGFVFYSRKEADMASREKKKIEYLEAHIDYSKPETILRIYEKALQERVFNTPVGIHYLRHLRDYLLEQSGIEQEKVLPVPVYAVFGGEPRKNTSAVQNRIQPAEKKDEKFPAFRVSVFMNVALVITIIAMFIITLNSDQPNILNYERVITNQYAGWEQELTKREQKVREKEKEFAINPDLAEEKTSP